MTTIMPQRPGLPTGLLLGMQDDQPWDARLTVQAGPPDLDDTHRGVVVSDNVVGHGRPITFLLDENARRVLAATLMEGLEP